MNATAPLLPSQRVVQICLFLLAAIALFGGTLQMYLGQPETTPRLDNVHRFLAGVYFGCGLIALWAALTIRQHRALIFLIALTALLGGSGRLLSIYMVGLPEPPALWLGYLVPELAVPCIIFVAQLVTNRRIAA